MLEQHNAERVAKDDVVNGRAASGARERLLFSIEGLPLRDELLLKSLVRILEHSTHQQWRYSADKADLKVTGDVVEKTAHFPDATQTATPVLKIGRVKMHDGPFLSLPLNAKDLEMTLNDMGKRITECKSLIQAPPTNAMEEYRLLKLPPAMLMAGPPHMKIATLIMRRSLPMAVLAERSGLSLEDCNNFIRLLQTQGFLEVSTPATDSVSSGVRRSDHSTAMSMKDKVLPGLLSRIRNRLGLAL